MKRRHFLAGAAAFGGISLTALLSRWGSLVESSASGPAIGYGPLGATPSSNTGEAFLELPEGFRYTILGRTGAPMADGRPTPGLHDGMAAFEHDGKLRIVRNHEINSGDGDLGRSLGPKRQSYDERGGGGTTTLVVDPETRLLERDFLSLAGTLNNCAGGPTPWGSWISCEETTLGRSRTKVAGGAVGGFRRPHGYCFEVPVAANGLVAAEPIREMGRFVHEAIAVDPRTGTVYETEDQPTSGFYRFLPQRPGVLRAGGRLQMLAVRGRPNYDTRTNQRPGVGLEVAWVEIPKPDPRRAERDPLAVYRQGFAFGGATFARLEGCTYGNGRIYFTATSGGNRALGQVWEYTPEGADGGALRLLVESSDAATLEAPDNLCVSPRGGLVVCEDGDGQSFLRGVTRDGQVFAFARNCCPGFETEEFAGATFSPDGRTLFVNIQTPGMTLAIWGPWERSAL